MVSEVEEKMKDLLIIYVDEAKNSMKELNKELKLLGVRTSILNIENLTRINEILSKNMKIYSAILFYLEENFSNLIIKSEISINTTNRKAIFMPYNMNQGSIKLMKRKLKKIVLSRSRSMSQYALDIIKEMSNEKRKIKLKHSNKIEDIWDSPLTIYQKKEGLNNTREILLDVAWSAKPTRPEMAPSLATSLRQTFSHIRGKGPFKILDFGAGKLRHTVILLKGGHNVTAVEYPEIFHNPSPTVKKFMQQAIKYKGRYGKVTYPNELISLNKTYDLIMLVNVIDIIPEPFERLFVLDQCNKKLEKNKYLLWFTQYGDIDQRKVVSDFITDGGCTIKQSRKTFYTEFDKDTIDLLLSLMGFKKESIKLGSGSNQAWLYKKINEPIINVQKIALKIRKVIKRKIYLGEDKETVIADLLDSESFINIGDILNYNLSILKTGNTKKKAYEYEKIIEHIVKYISKNNFLIHDIKRQAPLHKRKLIIDIKANWSDNSSLKGVLDYFNLKSSFVPIECKNYNANIGSLELGQILTRSHKDHRHFGVVFCRKIENSDENISDRLYEFYSDHNFLVIVLDDKDVEMLLKLKDEERSRPTWVPNNDARSGAEFMITEYIKKRIEEVIHHNKRKKSLELYKQIKSI